MNLRKSKKLVLQNAFHPYVDVIILNCRVSIAKLKWMTSLSNAVDMLFVLSRSSLTSEKRYK